MRPNRGVFEERTTGSEEGVLEMTRARARERERESEARVRTQVYYYSGRRSNNTESCVWLVCFCLFSCVVVWLCGCVAV